MESSAGSGSGISSGYQARPSCTATTKPPTAPANDPKSSALTAVGSNAVDLLEELLQLLLAAHQDALSRGSRGGAGSADHRQCRRLLVRRQEMAQIVVGTCCRLPAVHGVGCTG